MKHQPKKNMVSVSVLLAALCPIAAASAGVRVPQPVLEPGSVGAREAQDEAPPSDAGSDMPAEYNGNYYAKPQSINAFDINEWHVGSVHNG